jgi:hypothetical protein
MTITQNENMFLFISARLFKTINHARLQFVFYVSANSKSYVGACSWIHTNYVAQLPIFGIQADDPRS